MKKLIALILILALSSLVMASCADDAEETAAQTEPTSSGTVTSAEANPADSESAQAPTETDPPEATEPPADSSQTPDDSEKGEVLYTITFDEDDNGSDDWTIGDNGSLAEISCEGKILTATVSGPDPMMNYTFFDDLFTEDITCISFRICNATNHEKGEIFYTTDDVGGPTGGCSFLFNYANSGLENTTWETVDVRPEDYPDANGWGGMLYAIRYDVTDQGTEGKVMIESITFYGEK